MSKYDDIFPGQCDLLQAIVDEFADELDEIDNPYIKKICEDFIAGLHRYANSPQIEIGGDGRMVDEGYACITLPTYGRITDNDIIDVSFEDNTVVLRIRKPSIYEICMINKIDIIKSVYYASIEQRASRHEE